jgi:hypothetical protein
MSFVTAFNQFRDQLRGAALVNPDNSWTKEALERYGKATQDTQTRLSAPTVSAKPQIQSDVRGAQDIVNRGADAGIQQRGALANTLLQPRGAIIRQNVDRLRDETAIGDTSYDNKLGALFDRQGQMLGLQHGQERWTTSGMNDQIGASRDAYYALQNKIADATIANMNKGPSFMENLGSIGGLLTSILGGVALFRG